MESNGNNSMQHIRKDSLIINGCCSQERVPYGKSTLKTKGTVLWPSQVSDRFNVLDETKYENKNGILIRSI